MIHNTKILSFLLLAYSFFVPLYAQETCKVESVEQTFALIKPDAVAAGRSGDIIALIELNDFTITHMEKRRITPKEAEQFYSEHKNKSFFKTLIEYIISGPVIVLALEKDNAIAEWRAFMGATNPPEAAVGTLRRMFGTDKTHNAVHGSDSAESARRELNFFWGKKANIISKM